jgi:hypothetical protein
MDRGGLRKVSLATEMTCGICRIREMAFATFVSLGNVDCASNK